LISENTALILYVFCKDCLPGLLHEANGILQADVLVCEEQLVQLQDVPLQPGGVVLQGAVDGFGVGAKEGGHQAGQDVAVEECAAGVPDSQ